jgi:hypothetical protein
VLAAEPACLRQDIVLTLLDEYRRQCSALGACDGGPDNPLVRPRLVFDQPQISPNE